MDQTLNIVLEDPNLDLVLYAGVNPPVAPPADDSLARNFGHGWTGSRNA